MQRICKIKSENTGESFMKPLIGITCSYGIVSGNSLSSVSTAHMPQEFNQLSNAYVKAVENAGGVPVIIPLYNNIQNIIPLLEVLDGIVLSGGVDISSIMYGQRPSGKLKTITPLRDKQEIEIVNHIIKHRYIPVLGICRGMQILNIAYGGSLYQDLESNGFGCHLLNMYPRNYETHTVTPCESSILYGIFGNAQVGVNSFHHQAVENIGNGLKVAALSDDNVVEALENCEEDKFIIGIQWHPEELSDDIKQQEIFKTFINSCKKNNI
jgi:putative glutamine amidotransferase